MGSKGYQTGAHVVFKLSAHIVFVTKYRRKAITERVWAVMLAAFKEVLPLMPGGIRRSKTGGENR